MYMYVSVTQVNTCTCIGRHAALARAVAFSSKTCYFVRFSSERASTDPGADYDVRTSSERASEH